VNPPESRTGRRGGFPSRQNVNRQPKFPLHRRHPGEPGPAGLYQLLASCTALGLPAQAAGTGLAFLASAAGRGPAARLPRTVADAIPAPCPRYQAGALPASGLQLFAVAQPLPGPRKLKGGPAAVV